MGDGEGGVPEDASSITSIDLKNGDDLNTLYRAITHGWEMPRYLRRKAEAPPIAEEELAAFAKFGRMTVEQARGCDACRAATEGNGLH
jgi:hypothetical protein